MHSEKNVPQNGHRTATATEALHTIFGTRKPHLEPAFLGSNMESVTTNPRIVIIDDEPINIRVVRRMLMLAGYEQFFTTSEPMAAMELIRAAQPDVVLLDIMMPGISGLDILGQLRDDDAFVDLPVIILTAATDRETKLEALRLGATEFLTKPVDSTELEARLRNVLKGKAHQDRLKHYAWELELEVAVRTTELIHAHVEVLGCLARVGAYRGGAWDNHVLRVGCYAGLIAQHLGLEPETAQRIRLAAPLHDVGKIAIHGATTHRPGALDAIERHIPHEPSAFGAPNATSPERPASARTSHSMAGAEILANNSSPILKMAARIASTHHERWDGTGCPHGLAGDAIPIEGRITAVADAFDTLYHGQPGKEALPLEKTLAVLREGRGTLFDPAVIDAFFGGLDDILAAHKQCDEGFAEAAWTGTPVVAEGGLPLSGSPQGSPAAPTTRAANEAIDRGLATPAVP